MIGPYFIPFTQAVELAITLGASNRTYVFKAEDTDPHPVAGKAPDCYYFSNSEQAGYRAAEANADFERWTLMGCGMDGEWLNANQVHERKAGISEFANELRMELNGQ